MTHEKFSLNMSFLSGAQNVTLRLKNFKNETLVTGR